MYRFSEAAARDIEKLLENSLLNFGVKQTELYYAALKDCLDLLSGNPDMGGKSDDVREGYRRFSHQSHVIFYRMEKQHVLIVRVLHKSMDVAKQFQER